MTSTERFAVVGVLVAAIIGGCKFIDITNDITNDNRKNEPTPSPTASPTPSPTPVCLPAGADCATAHDCCDLVCSAPTPGAQRVCR